MSVYRHSTKLPLQWSTSELLLVIEKVYLHSHCFNISWALWVLSCRASVLGDISVTPFVIQYVLTWNLKHEWLTVWHSDVSCLCSYSCLMQLCKPMQVSSCRLSWLLGRLNPKNDFYKKSNRFGWNWYIYKKKCIPFEWKSFFRENYTCTLLFLGCFCFFHVCPNNEQEFHWWVWTASLISMFIWLFGCGMQ